MKFEITFTDGTVQTYDNVLKGRFIPDEAPQAVSESVSEVVSEIFGDAKVESIDTPTAPMDPEPQTEAEPEASMPEIEVAPVEPEKVIELFNEVPEQMAKTEPAEEFVIAEEVQKEPLSEGGVITDQCVVIVGDGPRESEAVVAIDLPVKEEDVPVAEPEKPAEEVKEEEPKVDTPQAEVPAEPITTPVLEEVPEKVQVQYVKAPNTDFTIEQ